MSEYVPNLKELWLIEQRFAKLLLNLEQNVGAPYTSLLKLFVSVLVSQNRKNQQRQRIYKCLNVKNGQHIVNTISDDVFRLKTIWGGTEIVDFLDEELGKALCSCRIGLEMLISRIPNGTFVDSFGSLTLAPINLSREKEDDLKKKFDDRNFFFPSSLFLLGELGKKQTKAALPVLMLSYDKDLGNLRESIHSLSNTININIIFENTLTGEILIEGEEWLTGEVLVNNGKIPLKIVYKQILQSFKYWTGYQSSTLEDTNHDIFGILFIPSGNDYRSRTALLCPVTLSLEIIEKIVFNVTLLVKLLGGLLEKYLAHAIEGESNERLRLAYTRSAITSIMSRNGSHNIGSHVLAALSHNVGTMPDDRVLYQYIQHRMDYIATATTDFPTWTMPTMFLGNIMKTFFSQRHLLDNIAESEGLKAWKFQGRNANVKNNKATIKFFIRKIFEDGCKPIEVLTNHESGGAINLGEDVSLAIPGGTVGQHAFFTILENIIRNAAKHDWSSPPDKTKCNKFDSKKEVTGNLEVYIEYRDIPKEGNVEFTIYTNMSDADDVTDGLSGKTSLLNQIRSSVNARFIDESGNLRNENWGIAEMKISAGYLQTREIGAIGGLEGVSEKAKFDEIRFGKEIITPVKIRDEKCNVNHLGYCFKVPKTRSLLIVTDDLPQKINIERKCLLAEVGIYIKTKKDAMSDTANNSFEFVLMDAFTEDWLKCQLPFRIVCTNPTDNCKRSLNLVAEWDTLKENTASIAKQLVECSDRDFEKVSHSIIEQVAASWIRYMKKKREKTGYLNLIISTEISKDNHSGQSLVNAAAAVKFVLEEGLEKAIKSFWELISLDDYPETWGNESKVAINYIVEKSQEHDVDESVRQSDEDIPHLLIRQFYLWLSDCQENKFNSIVQYLKAKIIGGDTEIDMEIEFDRHPFRKFVNYLIEVCVQAKGYLGQYSEKISTLPKNFISIFAINGAKNKVLKKAEKKDKHEELWDAAGLIVSDSHLNKKPLLDNATIMYYRHFTPTAYRENNTTVPSFVTSPFNDSSTLYIEPLSGTQSYLAQMRIMMDEKSILSISERRLFQAKLVECALLRILIIDERVSRFVNNHSDLTLATLSMMNISVADDKMITDELESEANKRLELNVSEKELAKKEIDYTAKGLVKLDVDGINALRTAIRENNNKILEQKIYKISEFYQSFKNKFDILIIHQGILDKWFQGVVDDKEKMSILYDSFKKVFSYVIITTGRGTPANIPSMARVLPFSTIETTLFRKYPEKLILVDAIMNILPIKKIYLHNEGSNA